MKILITGATGFLGKALALRLQQAGHQVTALGRNQKIGSELITLGLTFECLDLKNKEALKQIVSKQDIIFHAAALTKPTGHYQEFYESNTLATRNLIEACLQSSIKRFVHISTPSIYMTHTSKFNILEEDPLPEKFINHYAHTKKLAEDEVDLGYTQGLPCVTLRPQAIFGPGDQTLFPRILKLAKWGYYPKIGPEPVMLDLTYIDNIIDAALLAMTSKSALGFKINITNGEPYCLEQVFLLLNKKIKPFRLSYRVAYNLAKLFETFGREPSLSRYAVCALGKSRTLNIDRAKALLGYQPRISLEEGFRIFLRPLC